jgi:hypothetical protein
VLESNGKKSTRKHSNPIIKANGGLTRQTSVKTHYRTPNPKPDGPAEYEEEGQTITFDFAVVSVRTL